MMSCESIFRADVRNKIVRRILTAIIFLSGAALQADRMDLAIQEYRRGLPSRAEYHLAVAKRALPAERMADAFKLEALLCLAKNDLPCAEHAMRLSMDRRADAFLAYTMGRMLLDLRRYSESAAFYDQAARDSAKELSGKEARIDLLPFHCGETRDASSWNAEFADPQKFSSIWDAKLTSIERVAAVNQAGIIRKHFDKSPFSRATSAGADLPLLRAYLNTGSREDFAACNRSLNAREESLAGNVRRGSTASGLEPLRQVQMRREILLRTQVWNDPSEPSYEFAARYLRLRDKRIESLHAQRWLVILRMRRAWIPDEHDSVRNRLLGLAAALRDEASIYQSLDRSADRRILDELAAVIESANPETETQAQALRLPLFRTAGQNLRNRECLELLILIDSQKSDFYRQKIQERDASASDPELLEVFGPMYAP